MNKLTDKEGKRELLEASQKSFNERHGTKDKDSKIVTLSKGWVDFEEHEKTEDEKDSNK
jgi:hypothetical protein